MRESSIMHACSQTRLCLQGIDVSGIIASRGRWCPIKPALFRLSRVLAPNDSFYTQTVQYLNLAYFGRLPILHP